jgi:regulator of protease activity HflC (stomatin/prohibitin superfamily)
LADVHVINSAANKGKRIFVFLVICFFIFLIGCDTYKVVPAGSVGVITRFGKIQNRIMMPGLNFKLPIIERVTLLSTRLQEYTMSVATREGKVEGNDAITALTKEGLMVTLDLTAWFSLTPKEAPRVYNEIGTDYESKVIRPLLRTVIRDAVVKYTAEDLYTNKRGEFNALINQEATKMIEHKGVIIERILLRNINLPDKLTNAINEKQEAEQQAKKMQFVLEKERLEAERKVVEAKGIRESNQIISQGLTPNYIQWYRIEILKGILNSQNKIILVMPEDMKSLPMIMPITPENNTVIPPAKKK